MSFTEKQLKVISDMGSEMQLEQASKLDSQNRRLQRAHLIGKESAYGSALLQTFISYEGGTTTLGQAGSRVISALKAWNMEVQKLQVDSDALNANLAPATTEEVA